MADKTFCSYVRSNGKVCGELALLGYEFCRIHKAIAEHGISFPRQGESTKPHTSVEDEMQDQRAEWRDELNRDYRKHKDKMHGKRKKRQLKAKDFPQIIDGILFQTLDEYHEFVTDGGRDFVEMQGTDSLYDEWEKVAGSDKNRHQGNLFTGHSAYSGWTGGSYVPAPPKPEYKLDPNYYAVIGEIEHMRYIVYRDTQGDYFAIWVSLDGEDTLDDVMEAVSSLKLDAAEYQFPVQIPQMESRFYVRGPYAKYGRAEDCFYRGVETLHRIKERIRKAKDPNWIPPNLRQMALVAFEYPQVWAKIPKDEHPRLKKWLNDGAPGWYKSTPKGLRKGCMEPKGPKLLPSPKDKPMGQLKKFQQVLGQVWDERLKRWIPINPNNKPN